MQLDFSYRIKPKVFLVGYLGYNSFISKTSGIDDTYWLNISLNAKYRNLIASGSNPSLFYYVQAGPGYYIPEIGNSAFGSNLGLGFDYDISGNFTLTAGADYHTVFGEDMQFIQIHGGIIFRF